MQSSYYLILMLIGIIGFVAYVGTKYKLHPFLTLLAAALLIAVLSKQPISTIPLMLNDGFGNMMKKIALIVILGSLLGTILEKTGAILTLAHKILETFGPKNSLLATTLIGAIVGIPIFCDSGFIILSGLTKPIAENGKKNYSAVVTALASGLYITHTLLPPHPGSMAGASNLGLKNELGLVFLTGLAVAVPVTVAAWLFAKQIKTNISGLATHVNAVTTTMLPQVWKCIIPIVLPLLLIALGSTIRLFSIPTNAILVVEFVGNPVVALLIGFLASLSLVSKSNKKQVNSWLAQGLEHAANIIVVVGAGGVFGEVLKHTDLETIVQNATSSSGNKLIFLLIAWAMAAFIKSAQGSTTSAIIIVSSIIAPLAIKAGFNGGIQSALLLAAISAGSLMVSHTNDAYFWVIAQFSNFTTLETYRTFSLATVVMSLVAILSIMALGIVLLY